jgi:predicted phosphoribosyltransferase
MAAGQQLAERLAQRPGLEDAVVLALPRGGVPVGYEIAKALGADLDVMVVRKLGVPGHEELAMGAIASGGVRIMNEDVLEMLYIPEAVIERTAAREQAELERRERAYRGGREPPSVSGRPVILVDDGVATGSTIRAAIRAVRRQRPERVLVAVPVAPPDVCEMLRAEADEVVCLLTPEPFIAISVWYDSFPQLGDDEVRALLDEAARTARERGRRSA